MNAAPGFEFTAMRVAEPHLIAAKAVHCWADGSLSIQPYDRVVWWLFQLVEVRTLEKMVKVLQRLAGALSIAVLMGAPVEGLDLTRPQRRRWASSGTTLCSVARGWLPIDVDGVVVPAPLGRADQLVEAAIWIRDNLLPAEFGDVACIATPTARSGLEGEARLRLRLFFLLTERYPLTVIKRWAEGARLAGIPVDPSIFQAGMPIYTARPRFTRMPDPVPSELHAVLVPGFYGERVILKVDRFDHRLADREHARAPGSGALGVGDDWQAFLDRTVGGELSFFTPLTAGLGRAAHSDASADEIINFCLELITERGDPGRIKHYDARWLQQALNSFRKADRAARADIQHGLSRLFTDARDVTNNNKETKSA